jgi:hypothetical protein
MIVYTVVNLKEKVEFEKKYHLPYGYNNIPVHWEFADAMNWYNTRLGPRERKEFVIEKHESGYTDIVFQTF